MNFPIEICDKTEDFIPRDKDMKSPTANCIRDFVLYDIHLISFQLFPNMSFVERAFMCIHARRMHRHINEQRRREREQYEHRRLALERNQIDYSDDEIDDYY